MTARARFFRHEAERRRASAAPAHRGRIVSVARVGIGGAEAVRVAYLEQETRFLTRRQAEREPEVWALCTFWH